MADDKSKKTLPEQINIMKAADAGAPIVVKAYDSRRWMNVENPAFNWGTSDYKIDSDYTSLFTSVVGSLNYTELYDTLYYLERGKNLGNTVDYSVEVLKESKDQISKDVKSKFSNQYLNSSEDLTVDNLKDTAIYSIVYNAVYNKYYEVAKAETEADPKILLTYNSLNKYIESAYQSSIDNEMATLVADLNTTLKGITNDNTIQALVNIAEDTMDGIILKQKSVSEDSLYTNNADDIPTLKSRMSNVMSVAVNKYNNSIDETYAVAYDDDIRVTIKKQVEEPEPAISINYSLFNYSLNGDDNPEMDWGFNEEGKVATLTGITTEQAQAMVDSSYKNFINKLKEEETARRENDIDIMNKFNKAIADVEAAHNALYANNEARFNVMQNSLNTTIANLRKKGVFTDLSVTNPIQGSLTGNAVTTNKLDVKTSANIKDATIESISLGKDKPYDIATKISGMETNISNNSDSISTNTTNISTNTSDISSIKDSITSINTTLASHTTSIGSLDTTVGSHSTTLSTYNAKSVNGLSFSISGNTLTITQV